MIALSIFCDLEALWKLESLEVYDAVVNLHVEILRFRHGDLEAVCGLEAVCSLEAVCGLEAACGLETVCDLEAVCGLETIYVYEQYVV